MTVRELNERVDARELAEWRAYDEVNIPESYHQVATICMVLHRLCPYLKPSQMPKYEDFLPKVRKAPPKPMTGAEMRAVMGVFRAPAPAPATEPAQAFPPLGPPSADSQTSRE